MNHDSENQSPLVPRQLRRGRRRARARLQRSVRRPQAAHAQTRAPEVNAWVVIRPDDTVVIRIARSEMGQGTLTGLAQLVAEELECDWSKVTTEYPTPGAERRAQARVGQFLHRRQPRHPQVARIRAQGRRGGARNADPGGGQRVEGAGRRMQRGQQRDHAQGSGRTTTYGKVADAAAKLEPPKEVTLKDPKDWKIAGKPVKRLDTADKVTGKQVYGIDFKLPGMLNAAIKECPVFGGKVKSFDAAKVKNMQGVKKVVQIGDDAVAVVADTWWNAKTALDALPIEWDEGAERQGLQRHHRRDAKEGLDADQAFVGNQKGDAKAAIAGAAKKVEAVYTYPVPEPRLHGADERDGALHARQVRGVGADAERRGSVRGACWRPPGCRSTSASPQDPPRRRLRPARRVPGLCQPGGARSPSRCRARRSS